MPDLLTVDDLADRYHTTPNGIHQWRHKGKCPPSAFRAGGRLMFRLEDVLQWENDQAAAHQAAETTRGGTNV